MSNEEAIYALELIADSFPHWEVDDWSLRKAFIEDLKEALRMAKQALANQCWISVTERLPEDECDCWVHCENGNEFLIHFDPMIDNETERFGFWEEYVDPVSLGWVGSEWNPVHDVTHWMVKPELPEPPRGKEDAKNN